MKPDRKNQTAPSFTRVEPQDRSEFALNVIRIGANCTLPLFRYKWGDRYHQYSIVSFGVQVGMMTASPPMAFYAPLWLLFLLAGRTERRAHGLWGGFSRLGKGEWARFVEPVLIVGAGILFAAMDEPFGLFLMASGTCAAALAMYELQQKNRYMRKMRDDELEMEFVGEMRRQGF